MEQREKLTCEQCGEVDMDETAQLDPFLARNFLHSDHKNPAEAAALLWCKLVEEGIISSNEKE